MTRILAVSRVPAFYQTPIYRRLQAELGEDFLAVHATGGQALENWNAAWQAEIRNERLLSGYQHKLVGEGAAGLRGVAGIVRRFRPDAVLVVSHTDPLCLAAVHVTRALGGRALLRSTPYDLRPRRLGSSLMRCVALRGMYRWFDGFCAVGTMARIHFASYSGRPTAVFSSPYCCDDEVMEARSDAKALRRDVRAELGIEEQDCVFLVCGRLSAEKRVDWSLDAFQKFAGQSAARLIIAGAGPQADTLKERPGSNDPRVHWLGMQQRRGVIRVLAAADVLLLPSSREPWGAVVNEALAFDVVTVASDIVGCAPDLVLDGATGYRFPTADRVAFGARLPAAAALARSPRSREFDRLRHAHSAEAAARGVLSAAEGREDDRFTDVQHHNPELQPSSLP